MRRRTADVAVVGAGPSGRAIAHRLAAHGLAVTISAPGPRRRWRPTYACWSDELPGWVAPEAIAVAVDSVRVRGLRVIDVPRGYTVLDTPALQHSLFRDDITEIDGLATSLAAHQVLVGDTAVNADVVIDARGTTHQGPQQIAWGIIVPAEVAEPVLDGAAAVLMDWSGPSFLYAVPLAPDRVLLEETCLLGDPGPSLPELRHRLAARLARHGIDPDAALATERVSFGLTGIHRRPWRHRPLCFGARAGLMHPATGYSVAAALATADEVARAIAAGRDPGRTLWRRRARAVHALRRIGVAALARLPDEELAGFFDAFFALPVHRQRAYLSDRSDAGGVLAAMAAQFAAADRVTRRTLLRALLG
ncbi:MAG: lycopene cyclase family protein [Gordonia sp. (in: high G+C Gram-positive bacteria)]